ncbi:MAG: hypothetical protein JW986_02230 [Methanotrichaceae archaeon]|nr:hypothetical protein [Methanotrichaceae archaeon]
MLDEFRRYCSLQRDQSALASLLIYLKRKGGWVQLNQIWKDLGPSSGGPFWNQTTMMNKLDKLERLEVISVDRRVIPSPRIEAKQKANTFCRLNHLTPIAPHIFSMLKVSRRKDDEDRFTSELVEKPLDHLLCRLAGDPRIDPRVDRERQAAFELLGEVFGVDEAEVKAMIGERLASRGIAAPTKRKVKKDRGKKMDTERPPESRSQKGAGPAESPADDA